MGDMPYKAQPQVVQNLGEGCHNKIKKEKESNASILQLRRSALCKYLRSHRGSGMIMQQQLRTSPVVDKMSILTVLFREFQKSEIGFPIRTLSAGCGSWSKFIGFFHPYL